MKKVIRNNIINLPYSLHDGTVIDFKVEADTLVMQFQNGFVTTSKPFGQIKGNIKFEKIDWDFSFVYLLEYQDALCPNEGCFTGKKMSLKDFVSQHSNVRIDIVDETYGYNISKLDGYLSEGDSIKECRIEIYHLGDMSYIIEE